MNQMIILSVTRLHLSLVPYTHPPLTANQLKKIPTGGSLPVPVINCAWIIGGGTGKGNKEGSYTPTPPPNETKKIKQNYNDEI
jgi:hypothetical protein